MAVILFDWFKKKETTGNPTRQRRSQGQTRDYTESLQTNEVLTKGLYFGDYPGLKLASALAAAPIKIPVYFQGFPIPETGDEELDLILAEIAEQKTVQIQQVHIQSPREGTVWIWPKWVAAQGKLVWEFIPDMYVTDIIRDLDTNEVISVIVEESLTLSTGYGTTVTATRRRTFTQTRIDVQWSGDVPAGLKDKSMRNPTGELPIPFSHEADGDEIRGHSVYGRILSDLKSYHDIDYMLSDILSKFKIKIMAGVTDPDEFARANGFTNATDMFTNFELFAVDMMLYRYGKDEKPELLAPPLSAFQPYADALKIKFRKIIEGSMIPEIAWGLKTEGNLASVEENMNALFMYVRGLRREVNDSWRRVFSASLRLVQIARMMAPKAFAVTVTWDKLSAVSEKTKAEIFKNFCEGIARVNNGVTMTQEQLYKLWIEAYPEATEDTFEEFRKNLISSASFYAASRATDPIQAREAMGLLSNDEL